MSLATSKRATFTEKQIFAAISLAIVDSSNEMVLKDPSKIYIRRSESDS